MLKKMMLSIVILSVVFGYFSYAEAGQIVTSSTITIISNTNSNVEMFSVMTSGGSGVCANGFVNFDLASAGSADVYKRAFTIAMTAFMTGSKVNIHNYIDNTCGKAAWIQMIK